MPDVVPAFEPLEPRLLLSDVPVLTGWSLTPDTGLHADDQVTRATSPTLSLPFSEPVFGSSSDVTVRDPSSNPITPTSITGWGTDTVTVVLENLSVDGAYTVELDGTGAIRDLDLNALNGGVSEELAFTLDTSSPTLAGPPVVNAGMDLPGSRSEARTVTLEFSEPLGVGHPDLALRNVDTDETIDLSSRLVETVGNQVIVHLDRYGDDTGPQLFLADGNYELTLAGPLSDVAGNLTDYDGDGVPNETGLHFGFHKLLGDYSGDRKVTAVDFLLWKQHYGTFVPPSDAQYDLSGDGRVTAADFLWWKQQYGSLLLAASDGMTYTYDTTPPEVVIRNPEDGFLTNEPQVTVQYTVDREEKSRDFDLVEGENTLVIEETDPAENVGSDSITVTLDTIPPEVVITSPQQQTVFSDSEITVEYTVDGVPGSQPATLTAWKNEVVVTGTDAAGNEASAILLTYYNPGMDIDPLTGGFFFSPSGDGSSVAIPVGAVAAPADVSVTSLETGQYASSVPPDHELASVTAFLCTEAFASDVTITLPLGETYVPGTQIPLGILNEGTGEVELTGQTLVVNEDGLTASADVGHFSSYAALKPVATTGGAVGSAETPLPDLFTGTFSHTIPIELPEGRQEMTPSLDLLYRSSGGQSIVGYGWELTIPSIQRSTKNGVPSYDDAEDLFVFNYNGQNSELVSVSSSLEVWTDTIEAFAGMSGSTALAYTAPDGSQVVNTFDINGDDLPDRVLYDPSDPTNWWVQLNTGSGFDTLTLWADNVASVGGMPESMAISYTTADGRQLVDTFDIDGDGLPDRVLHDPSDPTRWWAQLNTGSGFAALSLWADTIDSLGGATGATAIAYTAPDGSQTVGTLDIDGDGLPDRVLCDPLNPLQWKVQLNNGAGFGAVTVWADNIDDLGGADGAAGIAYTAADGAQTVATLDIDGDGLTDRVLRDPADSTQWVVQRNTGWGSGATSGFEDLEVWSSGIAGVPGIAESTAIAYTAPDGSRVASLFDIDGDGLPDRVLYDPSNPHDWHVQRNHGTGFGALTLWAGNVKAVTGLPGSTAPWHTAADGSLIAGLFDLDGDGLADRVLRDSIDHSQWMAQLNNGGGFDGLYEARIESSFHRFYKLSDDTWRVVTKEGLELVFGTSVESRVTGAPGTFAWYVTKVSDPNGNYITHEYAQDQGQVYPSRIEYTGNETTGALPKYSVEFTTEARPDVSSSYISGVGITTALRVSQIEVRADGDLVRRYTLEYEAGNLTGRSLLTMVRTFGSDGTTEGPPVTLAYHEGQTGFGPLQLWSNTIEGPGTVDQDFRGLSWTDLNGRQLVGLVDINGDGLPDRVTTGRPGRHQRRRVTGPGHAALKQQVHLGSPTEHGRRFQPSAAVVEHHRGAGDSGPGLQRAILDRLERPTTGRPGRHQRRRVTGPGLVGLVDINGDGLPDRVMRHWSNKSIWEVQLNRGNSFGPLQLWSNTIEGAGTEDQDLRGPGLKRVVLDRLERPTAARPGRHQRRRVAGPGHAALE